MISGDAVSLTGGTATFTDKNAGANKTVTVTGLTLTGADAANYTANSSITTTGTITTRSLTVIATASNKVYDRNSTAAATLGDNRVAGDVFTVNNTFATFSDSSAGTGKTVTVTGISLSGTDAANYAVNTTATTTASITPKPLAVSGLTVPASKVYDGSTTAVVSGTAALAAAIASGVGNSSDGKPYTGDTVSITGTAVGAYNSKNVTTASSVSFSGLSLAGAQAGNYTLSFASPAATITPRTLTVTATAANKAYDRTNLATVSFSDNRVASDVLTISGASATFSDKNVATGKTVTATGLTLSGTDASNYALSNTSATATANISSLAITGTITASSRVYDGTTTAAIATRTLTGVISGDVVSLTGGAATFGDKKVGTGKTVTATGLTLSGADAGNYTVNSTATTTANIAAYALTITATGVSKVYDGTTGATVTLSDNRVSGDVLTMSYGSATFASSAVGTNVAISVTGISISGTDAGNYTYNTTASTTANITAAAGVPTVVTQPVAASVLPGVTATFSASANGNPTTVTWQVSSNNGTTWNNVTATPTTTTTNGVTTTTLSLTTALTNNGQLYRAVFTNATGSVTTNQALLNVSAATITGVGVQWGTKGSASLSDAAPTVGSSVTRLLPAGRTNDISWLNINRITITLDKAVSTLAVGDVKLASAVAGTVYTVTSVTGSGTTWTITFANNLNSTVGTGIINADRVTVTIGNGQLTSFARRLDVLPGDVNDDLAVNTLDTAAVKNYYTSGTIPTSGVAFLDVDGNGVVDVTDYNLVLGRVGKKLP